MEAMRIEAQTINHLQEWLGKTESLSDTVTAAPVRAYQQRWIDLIQNQARAPSCLSYGIGCISCRMQGNLKLVLMATPSAVAFFLQCRYHGVCGQVAAFSG